MMTRRRMSCQSSPYNLEKQALWQLNLAILSKALVFSGIKRYELIRRWLPHWVLNRTKVFFSRFKSQVRNRNWNMHQRWGQRQESVTQDRVWIWAWQAHQSVARNCLLITISPSSFRTSTIHRREEFWLTWRQKCKRIHIKCLKNNSWSWIKSNMVNCPTSGASAWEN